MHIGRGCEAKPPLLQFLFNSLSGERRRNSARQSSAQHFQLPDDILLLRGCDWSVNAVDSFSGAAIGR
eukprot:5775396-Pyramimonas_sp.AAC.1